jgi:hypothetical protein
MGQNELAEADFRDAIALALIAEQFKPNEKVTRVGWERV